jgi:hypothetical protein
MAGFPRHGRRDRPPCGRKETSSDRSDPSPGRERRSAPRVKRAAPRHPMVQSNARTPWERSSPAAPRLPASVFEWRATPARAETSFARGKRAAVRLRGPADRWEMFAARSRKTSVCFPIPDEEDPHRLFCLGEHRCSVSGDGGGLSHDLCSLPEAVGSWEAFLGELGRDVSIPRHRQETNAEKGVRTRADRR